MYVTYEYYKDEFGGNLIPSESFNRIIREAGVFIDYITFNRLKNDTTLVDEMVKNAICAVAESIHSLTEGTGIETGMNKASESVGDYSVTYTSGTNNSSSSSSGNNNDSLYYSIAKRYLAHTGLLYRGVY